MMYLIKSKSYSNGDYFAPDGSPSSWDWAGVALLCDGHRYIVTEEWSVGTGTVSNDSYYESYFSDLEKALEYYNESN